MALIQVNFISNCLQRTVPIQVILPVDKKDPDGKLRKKKKFKRRLPIALNGRRKKPPAKPPCRKSPKSWMKTTADAFY